MAKGKSYNRIVFLTTLSVYLGLVLVGGAPQVLAQTSKTIASTSLKSGRGFSDGELNAARLESFLNRVKAEVALQNLDLSKSVRIKAQGSFDRGALLPESLEFRLEPDDSRILQSLLKEFLVAVDESNLLRYLVDETKGQAVSSANLEISHRESETAFNFSFKTDSQPTAQKVAGGFGALFAVVKRIRHNRPEVKFYENASIGFENDQVFIVTRMPRAALEAFLADRTR